ncbi:MAG: hypothetical protein ACRC5C_07200, partial [Bacilli bacterium]
YLPFTVTLYFVDEETGEHILSPQQEEASAMWSIGYLTGLQGKQMWQYFDIPANKKLRKEVIVDVTFVDGHTERQKIKIN